MIFPKATLFLNTSELVRQRKQVKLKVNCFIVYFYLGHHRYVYLVYKQPGKIQDKEHGKLGFSGDKRGGWKVASFAQKHGLGNPVYGNFYQVSC
jgi:hypothetical protein